MEQQAEYDVLKLVENQGRCYVSSDCVAGTPLAVWLKYHPTLPREQLTGWMRQILSELDRFHRCRGNPCYQYVNPYSMIVGEDGRIHLMDLGSPQQQDFRKKLQRRSIRESFLMPDNQYYQRADLADDIYGIGRTFQYMLAAAETSPPIRGAQKKRLRKIIFRCLSQTPDQEAGGRSKKQYQSIQTISDQFPKDRQKKPGGRKKVCLAAAVVLCAALSAALLGREIFFADPAGTAEAKEKENKDGEAKEQEVREREDQELKFDMAMLCFLELEDYEKSREYFGELREEAPLAASFERLSGFMLQQRPDAAQLTQLLEEIGRQVRDRQDSRCELALLRGYSLLEPEEERAEASGQIISLGEHVLSLADWKEEDEGHEKEKSVRWQLADAYRAQEETEDAAAQYRELLELEEEDGMREQLYSTLAVLFDENEQAEEAWEVCLQGIRDLPESRLLRIQYIRMQCASPGTDRQICAQTVRTYLDEIPEIADEPEFQKLKEEYGIKVEGEQVWVGN